MQAVVAFELCFFSIICELFLNELRSVFFFPLHCRKIELMPYLMPVPFFLQPRVNLLWLVPNHITNQLVQHCKLTDLFHLTLFIQCHIYQGNEPSRFYSMFQSLVVFKVSFQYFLEDFFFFFF